MSSKALSPDTEQTIKEGLNRMYDQAITHAIQLRMLILNRLLQ